MKYADTSKNIFFFHLEYFFYSVLFSKSLENFISNKMSLKKFNRIKIMEFFTAGIDKTNFNCFGIILFHQ